MSNAIPGCCLPEDGHPAEEWRAVVGWEGIYQVSSHGRVRSVPRWVGNGLGRWLVQGQILAVHPTQRSRHLFLTLNRDGGRCRRSRTVHQLVAEAFIGPRPEGLQCRHLDDNKLNNHVSNIVYGTQSENTLDSVRNGTHNMARVTECVNGHLYTEKSTYYDPLGKRGCRICRNAKAVRWRERNPEPYAEYVRQYQRMYRKRKRAARLAEQENPPAA